MNGSWPALSLEEGEIRIGTFVQTPSTVMAEYMATLDFDFLCFDTEHSAYDRPTLESCLCAAERHGKPGLVRVGGCDAQLIAQALDSGAAGILVPRIDDATQARQVVRASRFPPAGVRGCGPSRAAAYGGRIPQYVEWADRNVCVAIQIETRRAVENLDEILSVPGIDLFLIGPGDLSLSYREETGQGFADVSDAISGIITTARERGARLAIYAFGPEDVHAARRSGMHSVILQSDLTFTALAATDALQRSRADHGSAEGEIKA